MGLRPSRGTAWLYATPAIGLRQGEDIVVPDTRHFSQSLNRVVVAAQRLYPLNWEAGADLHTAAAALVTLGGT